MQVKKKLSLILLLCVLAAIISAIPSLATVPDQINYQGQLTDALGAPVPDGTYTMRFYLFDAETGGNQLWNPDDGEEQVVTVTGGIYTVQLGAIVPLNSTIFNNGAAWLEVEVEGETLSPRQQVTATAYALKAGDADTLEGNTAANLDTRYVNEGQANAVTSLMIQNDAVSAADLSAGSVGTSEVADNSLTFKDILDGSGSKLDADYLDGYDSSAFVHLNQDYGRYNISSTLYEGTSSLSNKYVNEAGPDAMNGSSTASILSVTNTYTGNIGNSAAIYATSAGYYTDGAIMGVATGISGDGIYGHAQGAYGVGVKGYTDGAYGFGVYGYASSSGDTANYGGYFNASGDQGRGVYGIASNSGDVTNYGGYFQSNGQYGIGIYGECISSGGWAGVFRGKVKIQNSGGQTVMEMGEGLDYAEGFHVTDHLKIGPGAVMVIDSDNPGQLAICRKPYDKRVAGIIAGANNLGSGVRLGAGQFDHDVALAGRVYCNVDASLTAVEAGDLLTTSSRAGYAMKACDIAMAQGAILGKAMENIKKGSIGQILVLVTLQ